MSCSLLPCLFASTAPSHNVNGSHPHCVASSSRVSVDSRQLATQGPVASPGDCRLCFADGPPTGTHSRGSTAWHRLRLLDCSPLSGLRALLPIRSAATSTVRHAILLSDIGHCPATLVNRVHRSQYGRAAFCSNASMLILCHMLCEQGLSFLVHLAFLYSFVL